MENALYLLDEAHLPPRRKALPANSLALQIQDSPEAPQALPANYCLLKNNSSILSLFNQIQELFLTFDQWQEDLMCACLNGEPIQKLLEISQPVLNMPLDFLESDWLANASTPDAFREKFTHCRTLHAIAFYWNICRKWHNMHSDTTLCCIPCFTLFWPIHPPILTP